MLNLFNVIAFCCFINCHFALFFPLDEIGPLSRAVETVHLKRNDFSAAIKLAYQPIFVKTSDEIIFPVVREVLSVIPVFPSKGLIGHVFSSPQPLRDRPPVMQYSSSMINSNGSKNKTRPIGCYMIPSPGECRGAFPRYFYNATIDRCDCTFYGGCGQEDPHTSFKTQKECQRVCQPSVSDLGPSCKDVFIDDPHSQLITHISGHPDQRNLTNDEVFLTSLISP